MLVKCSSCNKEYDCGPGTFRCSCGTEIHVDPNGETSVFEPSAPSPKSVRQKRLNIFYFILFACLALSFLLTLYFWSRMIEISGPVLSLADEHKTRPTSSAGARRIRKTDKPRPSKSNPPQEQPSSEAKPRSKKVYVPSIDSISFQTELARAGSVLVGPENIIFSDRCRTLVEAPKNIKKYVVPSGVTEIGDYAFSGCALMTEIIISKSVTEIGKNAFAGCTSLKEIDIPASVTKIGENAFKGAGCEEQVKRDYPHLFQ